MQRMRLFIALELPASIQKTIVGSFKGLRLNFDEFRIPPPENIHITLKFLGETDINDIHRIVQVLESVGSERGSIDLELTHSLLLPEKRPQAISIAMERSEDLNSLFATLDARLAGEGLSHPEHRLFNPHITIARTKYAISQGARDEILAWSCKDISFRADTLTLFESNLQPRGPVYNALTQVILQ